MDDESLLEFLQSQYGDGQTTAPTDAQRQQAIAAAQWVMDQQNKRIEPIINESKARQQKYQSAAVPRSQLDAADLTGLMQFSDEFAGTNFAKSYRPPSNEARQLAEQQAQEEAMLQAKLLLGQADKEAELGGRVVSGLLRGTQGDGKTDRFNQGRLDRLDKEGREALAKASTQFESDIAPDLDASSQTKQIITLTESNDPDVLKSLPDVLSILIPKGLLGEVGNLAASEQRKIGVDQSAPATIERFKERLMTGQYSADDLRAVNKLARSFLDKFDKKIKASAERRADRLEKIYGKSHKITKDQALESLYPGYSPQAAKPGDVAAPAISFEEFKKRRAEGKL